MAKIICCAHAFKHSRWSMVVLLALIFFRYFLSVILARLNSGFLDGTVEIEIRDENHK